MRELNKIERKKIRALIEVPIPKYIKESNDEELLHCYEIGFMFANNLLGNNKIDPRYSPWGDGDSVIFDAHYTEKLKNLLQRNLSKEMNIYCEIYLDALKIFKNHFI